MKIFIVILVCIGLFTASIFFSRPICFGVLLDASSPTGPAQKD